MKAGISNKRKNIASYRQLYVNCIFKKKRNKINPYSNYSLSQREQWPLTGPCYWSKISPRVQQRLTGPKLAQIARQVDQERPAHQLHLLYGWPRLPGVHLWCPGSGGQSRVQSACGLEYQGACSTLQVSPKCIKKNCL